MNHTIREFKANILQIGHVGPYGKGLGVAQLYQDVGSMRDAEEFKDWKQKVPPRVVRGAQVPGQWYKKTGAPDHLAELNHQKGTDFFSAKYHIRPVNPATGKLGAKQRFYAWREGGCRHEIGYLIDSPVNLNHEVRVGCQYDRTLTGAAIHSQQCSLRAAQPKGQGGLLYNKACPSPKPGPSYSVTARSRYRHGFPDDFGGRWRLHGAGVHTGSWCGRLVE